MRLLLDTPLPNAKLVRTVRPGQEGGCHRDGSARVVADGTEIEGQPR